MCQIILLKHNLMFIGLLLITEKKNLIDLFVESLQGTEEY